MLIIALQLAVVQWCQTVRHKQQHAQLSSNQVDCTTLETPDKKRSQVPVLTRDTADHVPPSGLVRFRGMVSDTYASSPACM